MIVSKCHLEGSEGHVLKTCHPSRSAGPAFVAASLHSAAAAGLLALSFLITPLHAQQTTPQPPAPETQAPTPTPQGKVIFSRHNDSPTDASEVPATPAPDQSSSSNPEAPRQAPADATVLDPARASITFTAYDVDLHLRPAESLLAAHIRFTIRNSGPTPLDHLTLQLSSTLHWESLNTLTSTTLTPLPFTQHLLDTDADHTGQANEALIALPQPLAPGASMTLTAVYSGPITQSAQRLERIGAPTPQARTADWDQVTPAGTFLRGFGNVLWYPTASPPVFLGDANKLFAAVGQTKLRQSTATVHLRLTIEYAGDPPDAAFFNGRRQPLSLLPEDPNAPVATGPGIATADFAPTTLGFRTLNLFVTDRAATATAANLINAVTDHYDALPSYSAAAAAVQPLIQDWLGLAPLTALNIIDHPGQSFEDDALLITPLHAAPSDTLQPTLTHSLTHAWFTSSHVWLNEGVPQFLALLEIEQTQGREAALNQLHRQTATLALAEPAPATAPSSEDAHGQSLLNATDEIYFRTKSLAVLWMLRSLTGDDALKRALQLYRKSPHDDDPKEFQRILEQCASKSLTWFFDDWVYRDRGLPDLSIVSVNPRQLTPTNSGRPSAKAGGWLVAIEVRNEGDAAAEVPVTVRTGSLSATQLLRIPGRATNSIRILFEDIPEEISVNDGSVPESTTTTHTKKITAH